jgi:hypothetical protein
MASGTIGKLNFNGIGKVKILQKKFTELFKATRLAIYEDPENEVLADGDATIASVSSKPLPPGTELGINPMIKVSTFEKKMANDYGLSVRILDSSTLDHIDGNVLLNTLRELKQEKTVESETESGTGTNEVTEIENMEDEEMDSLEKDFRETDEFNGKCASEGCMGEDTYNLIKEGMATLYRHVIEPELDDPDDFEFSWMDYSPYELWSMIDDGEKEQFVKDYRHVVALSLVSWGAGLHGGQGIPLEKMLEDVRKLR